MMRRMNQRQARRMMEQLGMKVETFDDVLEVIIKTPHREVSIKRPEVTLTRVQGQAVYQVMGGTVTEITLEAEKYRATEVDVHLVAQQANVSPDFAKEALEETKGDLAQAILLLTQRRNP